MIGSAAPTTFYAIGKPGGVPHFAQNTRHITQRLTEGDVWFPIGPELPEDQVLISADGTSLEPHPANAERKTREAWAKLRGQRGRLLRESDWTQGADVPPTLQDRWRAYRQQLRDLPAGTTDPATPIWPTPPA